MKKFLIVLMIPFFILACNSAEKKGPKKVKIGNNEEVVTTFTNGNPQVVRQFEGTDTNRMAVYEKEYYEDGSLLKEGPVSNNKKSGTWKTYYRSGQVQDIAVYRDGVISDTITGYFENGNLKYKGLFKDGQKTGIWLIFDENGKLLENRAYMKPGEKRSDSLYMQK